MPKRDHKTYTKIMNSLTKCPFCDLKDKYIIKEIDGICLTTNLFPYVDGHLLIIPRRHVEKFEELTKKEWGVFMDLINFGMERLASVLDVHNINVLYRQGKGSGMSLGHLHAHLIPSDMTVLQSNYQELTKTAEEIARLLKK